MKRKCLYVFMITNVNYCCNCVHLKEIWCFHMNGCQFADLERIKCFPIEINSDDVFYLHWSYKRFFR